MEKDKKILLIEDNSIQRRALFEVLEKEGFNVIQAENGMDGVKIALDEHPDLIVVDLLMPSVDGFDVMADLRKDDWGRSAKVMVLTNSSDMGNIEKSMVSGAYDYVVKSQHTLDQILELIRGILK